MFLLLNHLRCRAERICQKPILSCAPHHFRLNIVKGKAAKVLLQNKITRVSVWLKRNCVITTTKKV